MASRNKRKILIAPLDWGLGHATRCIPIINEFLRQGCDVQIASSGNALALLKDEFRGLKFHSIASYGAEYSRSIPFLIKILIQLPKFFRAIKKEHQQTAEIIEREKIDLVISDNRYGCWSKEKPSIFVGHQLNLFSRLANRLQERALRKFSAVWIPDVEERESLAGHLTSTDLRARYVGVLSRMQWHSQGTRYEIMAIISGPEPQRTIFETIVIGELKQLGKPCLVVRGLPGQRGKTQVDSVEIINHLSAEEMNTAILESETIISRPGYSTIMDLAVLGKKAIFVPTPGQPEQEYLAARLARKKIAFRMKQNEFQLQEALKGAIDYTGFKRIEKSPKLIEAIEQLINETN